MKHLFRDIIEDWGIARDYYVASALSYIIDGLSSYDKEKKDQLFYMAMLDLERALKCPRPMKRNSLMRASLKEISNEYGGNEEIEAILYYMRSDLLEGAISVLRSM